MRTKGCLHCDFWDAIRKAHKVETDMEMAGVLDVDMVLASIGSVAADVIAALQPVDCEEAMDQLERYIRKEVATRTESADHKALDPVTVQ